MNDIDVRSKMTRELFEELASKFLDRAKGPLSQVCGCAQAGEATGHNMSSLPRQKQSFAELKCSSTLAQSSSLCWLCSNEAVSHFCLACFAWSIAAIHCQAQDCLHCLVLTEMQLPARALACAMHNGSTDH